MDNIFENAYFGKPYKTRDGRKAIYCGTNEESRLHDLVFQSEDQGAFLALYNSIGTYAMARNAQHLDIISEWEEPIDDKKLDELANDSLGENLDMMYGGYSPEDTYQYGFKAGYRKALEINKK